MRGQEHLSIDPALPISERMAQDKKSKPGLFRSFLQKFYPSKPESLPGSQALETFKFDELDFDTIKGKKMLYTILRRYPLIFRSVNIKSSFAVPDIDFQFNDEREKVVVELFLNNLHPSSGKDQLKVLLADLYSDTTAFGTGFFDPIWDKKKMMITGIKKIHPIDIDLIRDSGFGEGGKVKLDKNGNPLGWVQEIDGKKKELLFDKVAYLTFNTFGDEWLGISDLEPLYQTTWRLMNIEEGIATAIFRHGFPLYDVQVAGGTDGRPPTKEQLENAAEEVSGLNYKSEFIHPPNYKIQLLESFSMGATKDYVDPFIDQIAALSGIPRFILMGKAVDVAKSSFPELLETIELSLKPSQDKLKLFFEEQILRPLMEANHIETTPKLIIGRTELFVRAEKEKIVKMKKKEATLERYNLSQDNENSEELKDDEYLFEHKKLPGLILTEPHGNLLVEGIKKQIVKSKQGAKLIKNLIGKEVYLLSGDQVLSIIKLREPRKINLNDFVKLEYAHKVSSEERKKWWPNESEFFVYEFEIVKAFPKPFSFEIPKGAQVSIKEVIPK